MNPVVLKHGFLRGLAAELQLTRTNQRVTLFHLLNLVLPAMGLGIGIVSSNKILGSAIGAVVGALLAWSLPRVLWRALSVSVRNGWFVQTNISSVPAPIMNRQEFWRRRDRLTRDVFFQKSAQTALAVGGIFLVGAWGDHFEWTSARPWLFVPIALIFMATLVLNPFGRWISQRHGLLCPGCHQDLDITAEGHCVVCDNRIIESERRVILPLMNREAFTKRQSLVILVQSLALLVLAVPLLSIVRRRDWLENGLSILAVGVVIAAVLWMMQPERNPIGKWFSRRLGVVCGACSRPLYVTDNGDCVYCGAQCVEKAS